MKNATLAICLLFLITILSMGALTQAEPTCAVTNCKTCVTGKPTECQVCIPPYYGLTNTGQCGPCSSGCISCSAAGANKCQLCGKGYTLSVTTMTCFLTPVCPTIIPRSSWGASSTRGSTRGLPAVVFNIVIHSTEAGNCTTTKQCKALVKNLQTKQKKSYQDITYNFLIGGDGNVYTGMGWTTTAFPLSDPWNMNSYSIAFFGSFHTKPPTTLAIAAAQKLIACAPYAGRLSTTSYKLFIHSQLACTTDPQTQVDAVVQKWKGFTLASPGKCPNRIYNY